MVFLEVKKSVFGDFWHCTVECGFIKDYQKAKEIRQWCLDNFEKGTWSREDLNTRTNYVLNNEKDVALFVLRWS